MSATTEHPRPVPGAGDSAAVRYVEWTPEAAPPYKAQRPDADQYPTVETLLNVGLIMQALATTPVRVLPATNRPRSEHAEAA